MIKLSKAGYKKIKSRDIINLDGEVWKEIKGFKGLYEVSNMGRVKGLDHKLKAKDGREWIQDGLLMNDNVNSVGYLYVKLTDKNKKIKNKLLHRLVAEAFVKNPDPDECDIINHIDEDKNNNVYTNLEWCTQEYNLNYGTFRKRQKETYQKNKKLGLHSDKIGKKKTPVRITDKLGNSHDFVSVHALCDYLDCSRSSVSKVLNGKLSKLRGYRVEKITNE